MIIIVTVFIVAMIFLIIIGIIFLNIGYFKKNVPSVTDTSSMSATYIIPSPWMYGNSSYIPVPGPAGVCHIYTFPAVDAHTPGFPYLRDLITPCSNFVNGVGTTTTSNGTTISCMAYSNGSLIDDDQMFAHQGEHVCVGNSISAITTSGKCLGVNGQTYQQCKTYATSPSACALSPGGGREIFWADCAPNARNSSNGVPNSSNNGSRNAGTIGFITFNADMNNNGSGVLSNALCMSSPSYDIVTTTGKNGVVTISYANIGPLQVNKCDMTTQYNGIPSTIYRIERATFAKNKYTPSDSGSFVRFTHRPTGQIVGPQLIDDNPLSFIFNNNDTLGALQLYSNTLTVNLSTQSRLTGGYWWYLLSSLSYSPSSGTSYHSMQYCVYVPDPSILPASTDNSSMLNWVITNKPLIMKVGQLSEGWPTISRTLYGVPFQYYDLNSPNTAIGGATTRACCQASYSEYMDYAIIPMILTNPQSYSF